MIGCKGSAKADDIQTLADESVDQGLLGIMVWYASVVDGLRYDPGWDTSFNADSIKSFQTALAYMKSLIG